MVLSLETSCGAKSQVKTCAGDVRPGPGLLNAAAWTLQPHHQQDQCQFSLDQHYGGLKPVVRSALSLGNDSNQHTCIKKTIDTKSCLDTPLWSKLDKCCKDSAVVHLFPYTVPLSSLTTVLLVSWDIRWVASLKFTLVQAVIMIVLPKSAHRSDVQRMRRVAWNYWFHNKWTLS
jgi:hypothetical protein